MQKSPSVLRIGELPAITVGRFLKSKGLILSDIAGNQLDRVYPEMWGIGILEDHPYWPPEMRYRQIAVLEFYTYDPIDKSGRWVFLILGLSRLCELKNLAKEIADNFDIEVEVKIVPLTDQERVNLGCQQTAG